LPWQPDAAEHYFSLINLPWAMLLHSGHADHACNRFDILVADPLSTLVTGVNRPLSPMPMARAIPEDPFSLVKQAIDKAGSARRLTTICRFRAARSVCSVTI
jgi:para-aminobenzoate synthetase component 1